MLCDAWSLLYLLFNLQGEVAEICGLTKFEVIRMVSPLVKGFAARGIRVLSIILAAALLSPPFSDSCVGKTSNAK